MIKPKSLLKNKALNKWNLFWLISGPISIFMIINLLAVDASTGAGISEMIQFSVRWAVPFVYLVIATSSVQILFPGPFSRWLMRNRKYIGLCFAVAMAWQALFIFIMSYFFHEYYYSDVYYFRDEIEGSIGYIFLPAMVLTSFNFGSKLLTPKQWKLLHTSGIYFLWAYPFSVYWWNLYYYETLGTPEQWEGTTEVLSTIREDATAPAEPGPDGCAACPAAGRPPPAPPAAPAPLLTRAIGRRPRRRRRGPPPPSRTRR